MNESIPSHQDAQQLFKDFGLDEYRVGAIVKDLGKEVLTREVDYFNPTPEEILTLVPRATFSDEQVLTPGTRYSVSRYTLDHVRVDRGVTRDIVLQSSIYDADNPEYTALHATITNVPGPRNPELEGTPFDR